MKIHALAAAALLSCLSAFAADEPRQFQVGRTEAVRLRAAYVQWLAERPRKIAFMSVSGEALSKEARAAGFVDGSVMGSVMGGGTSSADAAIVALVTAGDADHAEGLLFGEPAALAQLQDSAAIAFTVEPTGASDVFVFRSRADAKPARAP